MLLKIIAHIKDSSYSDSTDKGIKDCSGFPSVAMIQKKKQLRRLNDLSGLCFKVTVHL